MRIDYAVAALDGSLVLVHHLVLLGLIIEEGLLVGNRN